MGLKTETFLCCDLHDEDNPETEGVVTRHLAFGEISVEIDLCEEHLLELEGVLQEYLDAGRRVSRSGRIAKGATKRQAKPAKHATVHRASIRDWARANGFEVGDRGRLPAAVTEAYEAANPAA